MVETVFVIHRRQGQIIARDVRITDRPMAAPFPPERRVRAAGALREPRPARAELERAAVAEVRERLASTRTVPSTQHLDGAALGGWSSNGPRTRAGLRQTAAAVNFGRSVAVRA